MCEDLTSIEFLNVRSLDYLPYQPCLFIDRGFFPVVCDWWGGWERPGWLTHKVALVQLSPLSQLFSSSNGFSLLFQPLYFVLDGTKTNRLVLDLSKVRMSCTSASEQSQSPAVRVAAFHFWVAEWTFSCACVQQALCVNSAFLLQQSSDHGKNFT